jgi:hypothetical protein
MMLYSLPNNQEIEEDIFRQKYGYHATNAAKDYKKDGLAYSNNLARLLYLIAGGKITAEEADNEIDNGGDPVARLNKEARQSIHSERKSSYQSDKHVNAMLDKRMDEEDFDVSEEKVWTGRLDVENGIVQTGKLFRILETLAETRVYLYLNATKIVNADKSKIDIKEHFLDKGLVVSTAKIDTIMAKVGMHKKAVQDAITSLEKKGLIKRVAAPTR